MRRTATLVSLALLLVLPAGCDSDAPTSQTADEEIASVVPPGKADDFLSNSAQEYIVEGRATIALDPATWSDATDEEVAAEVRRLVPYKQVVVGWFLNRYLVDKDSKGDDKYGGFKALTKNGAYEDIALAATDDRLVWALTFRQEIGGQMDLITALGAKDAGEPGVYTFDLAVGIVGTDEMQKLETDNEWYRKSPWSKFDPASVAQDRWEMLTLTIRPEPRSDDAWIDSDRLYADGKVTIAIHFGWDYHKAYHEVHSKSVYEWLLAKGFTSPVDSWENLRHDAGPLTGKTTYEGREVEVEVSLFWGRTGDATDPDTAAGGKQLEADMLDSLANREVVVFSGHSGPFYGFALANWRKTSEGDVDDSELALVDLNVGTYQVIVAEGCDTYAIGEAFFMNPSKPGLLDMDVITTTSFSNASGSGTVTDTLEAIIGKRYETEAKPTTWLSLLRDLDGNSYWFTSMYGVHGIDDNPTVHPSADLALVCTPCQSSSDCGAGMQCTGMGDGAKVCAAECTASRGCGAGFACRNTQSGGWLRTKACVPESLSCEVPVDEPLVLVVNEVLADPASGDAGDHNGDGVRSATEDEFVELVNASAVEVDLTGWTLSDRVMVRHTFPSGTVLPPGGALVVFGGGAVAIQAGTTVFQTASTGALGLNNGGDAIKLSDLDGNALAELSWGPEGGEDLAIVRLVEGDPDSDLTEATATPGTKLDGSQF